MTYALFVWTVTLMAGDRHFAHKHYAWQELTQTQTLELCVQAAQQLALREYRCIRTK